jgi:hypothetical protein
MLSKSKQKKPITGAPVAEVKISLSVTARIRVQIFSPLHLLQKKPIQFIYAAAKKPETHHSVMAAIINKQAEARKFFVWQ